MKRFNLLLLNAEIRAAHQIVKLVYRVFKKNFVFEVEEEEKEKAERILNKIHIDMVIVDLDQPLFDLSELQGKYPGKLFVGLYSDYKNTNEFLPDNVMLFKKDALQAEFLPELKAIKKQRAEERQQSRNTESTSPSFSDYQSLAVQGQN